MEASVKTLYSADHFNIIDFKCQCRSCEVSAEEYRERFSIAYVRSGSFSFKVFKEDLEGYTGRFLVNKPGYTHRVAHFADQADECTIISIQPALYEALRERLGDKLKGFLDNPDVHSLMLTASPATEYLHHQLYKLLQQHQPDRLLLETLTMELVDRVFQLQDQDLSAPLSVKHKQLYLPRVEDAKTFMQQGFAENISLEQVAASACMSMYHFNRVFKKVVQMSPHQYLLHFRLQHAERLLRDTDQPIGEVAYGSGFNHPGYFSDAFKAKYKVSPAGFRAVMT